MCSCKQTPLQKVERFIRTNGWAKLSGSQMQIIDDFIFSQIESRPSTNEERPDLYAQAKHKQNTK